MRIYWDQDEIDKVVDRLFVLRMGDPRSALTSLMEQAQKVLPEDRRRNLQLLPDYILEPLNIKIQALMTLERENTSLRDQLKNEQHKTWNVYLLIEKFQHRDILDAIGIETIFEYVKDKLVSLFKLKADTNLPPPELEPEPVVKKRKRLAITNLKGSQYNHLAMALPDFDIISIVDENMSIPSNCDVYVVWVSFCSHSLDKKMKNAGGSRYLRVKGGISTIVEQVKKKI